MADIILYSGSSRRGKTSNAFSCIVKKELMREYILSFGVMNSDSVAKLIAADSICECDGQKFDLIGYKKNSGQQNLTAVDAQHVNYRLLNYLLPIGYAFIGTVAQIAQDILTVSGASAEFTVGTCYDVGSKSFALGNTQIVTAKYALIAMKSLGVEVDYDNFTINFPLTVGSGNSETFQFGVNMSDVNTTYQKGNGTTYDIAIANLQRIDGHAGDVFAVGDTVTIADSLAKTSFTKRIITYTKCYDDPTQDAITLGIFIRDSADDSAAVQVQVDNSVQLGVPYNNVKFSHSEGVVTEATFGGNTYKVMQNATEGISIYKGAVKIFGIDSATGKITITDDAVKQGFAYSGTTISASGGLVCTATIDGYAISVTMSAAKPFELSIDGVPQIYIKNGILITSPCDINEDGYVDWEDLDIVTSYVLSSDEEFKANLLAQYPKMDVNHSGTVISTDLTLIARAGNIRGEDVSIRSYYPAVDGGTSVDLYATLENYIVQNGDYSLWAGSVVGTKKIDATTLRVYFDTTLPTGNISLVAYGSY